MGELESHQDDIHLLNEPPGQLVELESHQDEAHLLNEPSDVNVPKRTCNRYLVSLKVIMDQTNAFCMNHSEVMYSGMTASSEPMSPPSYKPPPPLAPAPGGKRRECP